MPQNLYETIWVFFIYALLGWCAEVVFAAVIHGKFVNRGFLNGPVCPIYGIGMLICVLCLWELRENPLLLFIGAFAFTTTIEYITGFALEKIFNTKWWDYSDMPFNIKGYICPAFSILWGLAATFIIGVVHPFVMFVITSVPHIVGYVLLPVIALLFIVDIVLTVNALMKLPKQLKAAEELEKLLCDIAESLGENISDKTVKATKKISDQKPKLDELQFKIDRKRAEYKRLYDHRKNRIARRIGNAFPDLTKGKYKKVFDKLKNKKH